MFSLVQAPISFGLGPGVKIKLTEDHLSDLEIILAFLAASTNFMMLSAKAQDFSTLLSESDTLEIFLKQKSKIAV